MANPIGGHNEQGDHRQAGHPEEEGRAVVGDRLGRGVGHHQETPQRGSGQRDSEQLPMWWQRPIHRRPEDHGEDHATDHDRLDQSDRAVVQRQRMEHQ